MLTLSLANGYSRHKLNLDSSLARYKARWVIRGYSQQPSIDYSETFSPVIKPYTIRLFLNLDVSSDWPIYQLDVKNMFLHGSLQETIYCQQPTGYINSSRSNLLYWLNKSLYSLKQACRAWFHHFARYITSIRFVSPVLTILYSSSTMVLTITISYSMLTTSCLQPRPLNCFTASFPP